MSTTLDPITAQMREAWSAADFSAMAARNILVSELLVRAAAVHAGERVLDVAAGTGNSALAAARRDARVTASDFVPAMLETAARRAANDSLELEIVEADAQNLPFDDDSFDVVLSSFGAMFAPDHQRTADELARVCRPGGRIAMANWTPDGALVRMQKATADEFPVPQGPQGPNPFLWGTEEHWRELFGERIAALTVTEQTIEFCAISAAAQIQRLRTSLGPMKLAFDALDPAGQQRLATVMTAEWERNNRATDGTLLCPAEYVEIVATLSG